MGREIERKFLVCGEFLSQATSSSRISQGYIAKSDSLTLRIRTRDERGYLTIKGPSADGISRFEWEKEITLDDARALFTLFGERIEKTRYLVKNGKHTVEIDEFHGENEGLVFAEIELSTVDEEYILPPYLGREVTGDRHYYNSFISHHPYPTWKEEEEKH